MSTLGVTPQLFVDCVVFQIIDHELCVLLIMRDHDPFKGVWSLPGGSNPVGKTTLDALEHVMYTKAGIQVKDLRHIEQLYTFDTVKRDPRGHGVSVTYLGLGKGLIPSGSSTTAHPQFFPLNKLPQLAFDHSDIITYAHNRLISKLSYTNAVFSLIPRLFTLTQLQSAYEAVFNRLLDKRNFRKKFLSLGLIQPTQELQRDGPHRPARLYRFNKTQLEILDQAFD